MTKYMLIFFVFLAIFLSQAMQQDTSQQLMQAVFDGRYKDVKRLAEHGADVNAKDNHHETPLIKVIHAVGMKHTENRYYLPTLTYLLQHPSLAIEAQTRDYGYTALMIALFYNNRPMTHALLKAGASVAQQDKKGNPAKYFAQNCKTRRMVRRHTDRVQRAMNVFGDVLCKHIEQKHDPQETAGTRVVSDIQGMVKGYVL